MTNQNAPLSAPEIDAHLDAILRASGSALRNYSLPGYLESMRAAVRAVASDAVSKLHAPVARPPVCAPTWEEVKEANSVLASYSWNSNGEGGGVTATERKLAAALLRVAGVDWNPNGDPVYALGAPGADERPEHIYPLNDFQEGQWWIKKLDEVAQGAATDEFKRAVAVVHHLLRAIRPASAPVADESPMAKMAEALREKARQEQRAYQDRRGQATEWGPMPAGTEADDPSALAALADGLESIVGNENAKLAAVIIRRMASAPVAEQAALSAQSATKDDKAALGLPECGKPLCAPGEHHPLCRHGWAEKKAASAPVAGDGKTRVPGDQLGGPAAAWDDGAQSDPNWPESRASIESKGGALAPVAGEAVNLQAAREYLDQWGCLADPNVRALLENAERAAPQASEAVRDGTWPMLSELHLHALMFAYNEGYSKAYDGRLFPNPFSENGSQAAAWQLGTDDGTEARAALSAQPADKPAISSPSSAGNPCPAPVPAYPQTGKPHTDGGAVYG